MPFADRLKSLRQKRNMTQEDLSKAVGIGKSAIAMYETGKREPKLEVLELFADFFNVDMNYIVGKTDKTTLITSPIPVHPDIIPITGPRLPIVGTIAAGKPILADENIEGYAIPADGVKADFALRVKGDSMENVPILDGDIAFIRQQPEVENGEIAAILIDGEATLKRFYRRDDSVMLVAENPQYAPMIYTADTCEDLRVLGKAVAYQHSLECEEKKEE